jgi:hypothetical protein
MGTIKPIQDPQVRVVDGAASRPPVSPSGPRGDSAITPAAQSFLRERRFATRLVEKEALLDAVHRSGDAAPDVAARQGELADAEAQLEQVKLYSPYPPNESPRAAMIRRLSGLKEPPGDPSTLDLGVTKVRADASDAEIDAALGIVRAARADLKAQAEVPAGQSARTGERPQLVEDAKAARPGELPSAAVELSQGIRAHFRGHAGLSVSGNARYLRTL